MLDIVEDVSLWLILGRLEDTHHDLTVSFDQVLSNGEDGRGFTQLMLAFVIVGALLQAIGLLGYLGARSRGATPMANVPEPVDTGGIVICCSGGGVRSAAFSLGGLQVLEKTGIYQKAKAVVGVSGGGYMGAAYHVLRWNPADESVPVTEFSENDSPEWPSLNPEPFASDSPETQWVRRHTRYVMNSVRVAVSGGLSLAFGIAVNVMLIAAVLGGTAWILGWLMLASGRLDTWSEGGGFTYWLTRVASGRLELSTAGDFAVDDWSRLGWVWLVPLSGGALFLVEKGLDRYYTVPYKWRSAARAVMSWLLLGGGALTALLLGVPWLIAELGHYAATSGSATAGLIYQVGLVPKDVCDMALKSASACGTKRTADPSVSASVITVSGVSVATVVSSVLAVLASVKSAGKDSLDPKTGLGRLFRKVWDKIKDPIVPWAAVVIVLIIVVVVFLRWIAALIEDPNLFSRWDYAYRFGGLLVAAWLLTDANRTSLHHFLRERISYAFLVRRRPHRRTSSVQATASVLRGVAS